MKKGMKKMVITANCRNKAEMIGRAIGFIIEQEGKEGIIESKWGGHWDGFQWDSKYVFINPQLAEKHNETILDNFGVEFSKI